LTVERSPTIAYHFDMERYCLSKPIGAVISEDGKRIATSLDVGAVVNLLPGQVTVPGMVDVIYRKRVYSVFPQDLDAPSRPVKNVHQPLPCAQVVAEPRRAYRVFVI
jgi:hypothetical protein